MDEATKEYNERKAFSYFECHGLNITTNGPCVHLVTTFPLEDLVWTMMSSTGDVDRVKVKSYISNYKDMNEAPVKLAIHEEEEEKVITLRPSFIPTVYAAFDDVKGEITKNNTWIKRGVIVLALVGLSVALIKKQ